MFRETAAICDFLKQDGTYRIEVRSLEITEPETRVTAFAADPCSITKLIIENSENTHVNRVCYFPRGLPALLPNLEELSIVNCGLQNITAEDLQGLNRLKILNLSRNQLEYLPDDLFTHVPQLRRAIFENNKIKLRLLDPLTNHEVVDLRRNEIIKVFL